MADKELNLFDECAAECVHLFPQELFLRGQLKCKIWHHSKFAEDVN